MLLSAVAVVATWVTRGLVQISLLIMKLDGIGAIMESVVFFHLFLIQTLSLRQNLIKNIENLDSLTSLRELDLYDNQIRKLENLQHLTELE